MTDFSSPIQITGTTWKQVSAGVNNTVAIKTDGTLWTWGRGDLGTLGNNDTASIGASSPVQTINGGTNWRSASTGGNQCAAIKTDGTLWTWGYNTNGALGDNGANPISQPMPTPIQTISGGSNWKNVVVGNYSMLSIRDDSADIFRSEPT